MVRRETNKMNVKENNSNAQLKTATADYQPQIYIYKYSLPADLFFVCVCFFFIFRLKSGTIPPCLPLLCLHCSLLFYGFIWFYFLSTYLNPCEIIFYRKIGSLLYAQSDHRRSDIGPKAGLFSYRQRRLHPWSKEQNLHHSM